MSTPDATRNTARPITRYGLAVTLTPCGEIASRRTRYRATPWRGSKYVVFPTRNTAHNPNQEKL